MILGVVVSSDSCIADRALENCFTKQQMRPSPSSLFSVVPLLAERPPCSPWKLPPILRRMQKEEAGAEPRVPSASLGRLNTRLFFGGSPFPVAITEPRRVSHFRQCTKYQRQSSSRGRCVWALGFRGSSPEQLDTALRPAA